jgi:hypothetical protein
MALVPEYLSCCHARSHSRRQVSFWHAQKLVSA